MIAETEEKGKGNARSWGLKGLKFREVQERSARWVWVMLGLLVLVLGYRIVYGLSGGAMGDVVLPKLELLGLVATFWLFAWIVVLLSTSQKMVTEVRERGVYVRFVPYVLEMEEISLEGAWKVSVYGREANVRRGVRRTEGGVSYSAGGSEGVRIDFKSGTFVEIGSRRAEELAGAIVATAGPVAALVRAKGGEVEAVESAPGIHIERDRPREFVVMLANAALLGAGGWQVVLGVKQGEPWRIAAGGVLVALLAGLVVRRRLMARVWGGELRSEEDSE